LSWEGGALNLLLLESNPTSAETAHDAKPEVSYWIGKPYWGKGVATKALSAFLTLIKVRPLYARAAKDHSASLRVLEKCGFTRIGEGKGFANARNEEGSLSCGRKSRSLQ
jgi:RimJ/RimL family protein N-acetyltransferase